MKLIVNGGAEYIGSILDPGLPGKDHEIIFVDN